MDTTYKKCGTTFCTGKKNDIAESKIALWFIGKCFPDMYYVIVYYSKTNNYLAFHFDDYPF